MPSLAHVLREVRRRSNRSQSELAELLGQHQATISYRETGRTAAVPTTELERLVELTGQELALRADGWHVLDPPDPFPPNADRDGALPAAGRAVGVPILGEAGAGPARLNLDRPDEWLDVVAAWRNRIDGVIRIVGNSMAPRLWDGDYLGIRLQDAWPPTGQVAVVQVEPEGALFVKLFGGLSGGLVVLSGANRLASGILTFPEGECRMRGVGWGRFTPGLLGGDGEA